jgi:PAS domain S-box-containing protein
MKVDNAINYLVLDILKNIIGMADNPAGLGAYLTSQVRELIGARLVILLFHNSKDKKIHHELLGVCPERKKTEIDLRFWDQIAENSHDIHTAKLFSHKKDGTPIEQLLSEIDGEDTILVPLEFSNQRVGMLIISDIFDKHNIHSIIDSLEALSGVLAIELRNATMMENLETLVAERTKELSESEKRFRTIIEQATDAIFMTDLNGNIIDTNLQACKSLGYSHDELLKLNVTDVDVLFQDKEKLASVFKNMVPNEKYTFESVHRKKNGETFPVEINNSLIYLEGNMRVIGFVRDISERKENEQKIVRMSKHYQALIEKAPDGIVLIDAGGNFKYISPSARKMFGYLPTDEITGHPAEFTHPNDLPGVLALLQNLMENPADVPTLQYRFTDKNNQWRWVESTFSNLLADPGVEAIVINFRDITDRKLAEEEISKLNQELEQKIIDRTNELERRSRELIDNEAALINLVEDLNLKSEELQKSKTQLEMANRELEAFSYSVSHDLRAPLRAISGFINILIEDYDKILDAEGRRICNVIQSNATKMGQLIDDLLSFSRLIRSEIHQSKIDMEKLVNNVLADFETFQDLSRKNIEVKSLPSVSGDPNMLKQVWINLIGNAIKYSSKNEQAHITIGSFFENGENVFFVKDNGVGFNMEYVHKLFGVFQRLHSTSEFEGTGVGLAIVQRIIKRHGGRVWAESEAGKGAVFYFSLPA